jgi:hypothetical protein
MNYPSAKTIMTGLNVDKKTAETIRRYMRNYSPWKALKFANALIEGAMGVEYIPAAHESMDAVNEPYSGLDYLNFGDSYTTTLLFDHKKERYYVCAWGDIVENSPRRFGE